MDIEIEIKEGTVEVRLVEKKKPVGFLELEERKNLSENLLRSIDKILAQNDLSPIDIRKVRVISGLSESFTTYRIAKATADAFNWGVSGLENSKEASAD